MLRYVKHAIVMGNGEPELFKLAYYVIKILKKMVFTMLYNI
ncbi:MAG: hypothetical protein ACLRWM_01820 [Streptococcus sp.]